MTDWTMVGAYASWAGDVVAALALIAAGFAAAATYKTNVAQQRTLELQRQQFEAAQEQTERAQASQVAFYIGPADELDASPAAHIINASTVPIFRIAITEGLPVREAPPARILYVADYLWSTGPTPAVYPLDPPPLFTDPTFRMYFKDAAGVDWMRDQAGTLRKPTEADDVHVIITAYKQERQTRSPAADDV